jgi:DNA-directed RNA polymerase subunit RPC12/RpoP
MAEFKFSCPQCGQKIRGDVGYAGLPINCPACQQPIVVPPPPSQSPIPPATRAAAVKPPGRFKLPVLKRFKLPPRRILLIAGVSAAALAAVIITTIYLGFWNSTRTIWNGWTPLSGDKKQWSFSHGKINGHSTTAEIMLASPGKYSDVTFSATVENISGQAAIAIRMQDRNNGYLVVFAAGRARNPGNGGSIVLEKMTSGNGAILATTRGNLTSASSIGQTAKIRVIARGTLMEVLVDGKKVLQARDSTFTAGRMGIAISRNANLPGDATFSKVSFR